MDSQCLLSRSIQKLEEMNIGIDHHGDEVTPLGQHCNGLADDGSTSNTLHEHVEVRDERDREGGAHVNCMEPQEGPVGF